MDKCTAYDFFDNYELCWQNKYWSPYDPFHRFYEVIKNKDNTFSVNIFDSKSNQLLKTVPKEIFLLGYKDYAVFYTCLHWKIRWLI